jgi:hypothetical protein
MLVSRCARTAVTKRPCGPWGEDLGVGAARHHTEITLAAAAGVGNRGEGNGGGQTGLEVVANGVEEPAERHVAIDGVVETVAPSRSCGSSTAVMTKSREVKVGRSCQSSSAATVSGVLRRVTFSASP